MIQIGNAHSQRGQDLGEPHTVLGAVDRMGKKFEATPENPKTKFLIGCFSAPPGLCIGDVYTDSRISDPRHKGKGFGMGLWTGPDNRTKQCAPGTFKLSPFLFDNFDMRGKEHYKAGIKYLDRFKGGDKRPKGAPRQGFMSTDFPKRDEYTDTIRTAQLREVLKREAKMAKLVRAEDEERMKTAGIRASTAAPDGVGLKRINLYDLVFRIPQADLHRHRDDRQGKIFFQGLRQKQKLLEEGKQVQDQPKAVNSHTWVNVTLPNGDVRQILVNEEQKVLAKRPMSAHN